MIARGTRAALARGALWFLTHSLYRVRVAGRENVPAEGGALLVSNHVSFVDGLVLRAAVRRPIRFLMHRDYARRWLRPVAWATRAIPVSAQAGPRALMVALAEAGTAVAQGEVVCVFAEGQISRSGDLLPFARGLERIMQGREAPIVPVFLGGLWGSAFSFSKGRLFWKLPERLFDPVSVRFGRPLPAATPACEVRRAVKALAADDQRSRPCSTPGPC